MATDRDILKEALERFGEVEAAEAENRQNFIDDVRFGRYGEQWHETDRKARENDGRPCLTVNRMNAFIRQVVNDARLNKPTIRAIPVDSGADPETAEVINGLVRNIEAMSGADAAYDTAIENAASGGFGYLRVGIEYADSDTFDRDIVIQRVMNPLSVYGDPAATSVDGSDWNSAFVIDTWSDAEFKRKFPDAAISDWSAAQADSENADWFQENRIRVAEHWVREDAPGKVYRLEGPFGSLVVGDDVYKANKALFEAQGMRIVAERERTRKRVRQYLMTGAEVLETNDFAGEFIPLVPVYGDEVVIEGRRYFRSLIADAKDSQRMYNYWRTLTTELVALAPKAPFIGPKGAFKSDARWEDANRVSYPFLEYDPVTTRDGAPMPPPQRQPFTGPPAGAIQEALSSSDDMKAVLGLYDAALGARSNETSGRAIMARQREGDISTFHFIDNLARSIRHLGRVVIGLIPHVYNEERVIRVLGEDMEPSMVRVNQPQQAVDERGQAVRRVLYDLTVGRYDVIVKVGPSFTTAREEAATQMMELLRVFPDAAPIIGDLLAKNLDWPGADEIAERMARLVPPQAQGEDPRLQQAAQAVRELQAELERLKADQAVKQAEIQIKAADAGTKRYQAETDRFEAVTAARNDAMQASMPAVVRMPGQL